MSERVLVRLAPELHRAIRRKADDAGVSMNSWVVQVLAAAAGPAFFHVPEDGGAPRTVGESRMQKWRDERELQAARAVYLDRLYADGVSPLECGRRMRDDAEVLRYYREVYLPKFEADVG